MLLSLNTIRVGIALSLALAQTGAAASDYTSTSSEPIIPIPLFMEFNTAKAALGAELFVDTRLSHDNSHSCASCHQLDAGGAQTSSVTLQNSVLQAVNTPTVYNAAYNYRHGWFGSIRSLEDQVAIVLQYMATDTNGESQLPMIAKRVAQDSKYHVEFTRLYRDGVSSDNLEDALTEYLKSLTTPNARFDRYLRGDVTAITDEEKQGYALFKEYGCISCHQGISAGGNLYQKFGIFYKYFEARGHIVEADNGRFNLTGRQEDRHVFRVPSLRNVELTAPYLHDGEANTLEQVVEIMGRTQLGKSLTSTDIQLIVKFLRTLTGEYNGMPLGHNQG